jgi:hypothetical protein
MSLGLITLYSATVPTGFSGTWPASAGAPVLSGTNGTLCAVLDWALAQKGWTTTQTSTNARVYKQAAGLGMSLSVNHDIAVSGQSYRAVVRGCESATSTTSLVNAFPTLVQQPNANQYIAVSDVVGSAGRPYIIYLTDRYIRVRHCTNGVGSSWNSWHFGDCAPADPSDVWFTVISQTNSTTGISMDSVPSNCFVRDITGTINSSFANFELNSAPTLGAYGRGVAARSGYMNRVLRQKLSITCDGAPSATIGTTSQPFRVWVPNLWQPLHISIGSLSMGDSFADSAYNPASSFSVYGLSNTAWSIDETTDTWAAPIG